MPWIQDDPGDQSEGRGPTAQNDRNPNGSDETPCLFAIPRVVWTIVKVTFNAVVLGKRPGYVQ